uniref:Store-operated calcium entry-associated regulatory factor n=1 Tax=Philodina roseola TaxID=96448 RepID=B5AHC2_PHIRO|nr:7 transmembrane protein 66 [Philodina roseola]
MKVAFLIFYLFVHLVYGGNQNRRVLLSDVQTLTLHKGEKTNARRVSAVPQLKCVGGRARGAFEPDVVQCYNRGQGSYDIEWECNAEMPKEFKFGKLSVSCEGFDYPDDPYILAGSCGLEYNLEYTDKNFYGSQNVRHSSESRFWPFVFKVALIVGVFFILRSFLSGNRPTGGVAGMSAGPDHRPPGGGGGWFSNFFPGGFGGGAPGTGGRQPPPPGFRTDYTFDNADCHTARQNAQQGGTGNFFTGAALGALGGYLFGARNRRTGNYYAGDTTNTGWFGGGGTTTHRRTASPSFGGGGGGTHTSTGFGGTTRR